MTGLLQTQGKGPTSDARVSSPTLLVHAAQLLTLRGTSNDAGPRRGTQLRELGVIEDGAVLLADGKIVAVGTTDQVGSHVLARKAAEIDCSHSVVLPGFVDSHTHPAFTTPRLIDFEQRISGATYEEIAAAGGGIRSSLRGVRESSQEILTSHIVGALEQMASHGTTTVEAKSGYGLSLEGELKSLEAIREASQRWQGTVVPTLLGAHVVPPEFRENPAEYVRMVREEMIPAAAERNLARFVDVFCERGAFTMEQSLSILRTAVEHGMGVRAHVCQLTPAALGPLLDLHPASFDHMDFVSDGDIASLAKVDTVVDTPARSKLLSGTAVVSTGAKTDRGGCCRGACDRLQPRDGANAIHAFCLVGGVHPYEDVARRGDHRRDLQRSLRVGSTRQEGKRGTRERRRHRSL